MIRAGGWGGAAAVLIAQATPVVATSGHGVTSTAGFVLRYPSGWTRTRTAPDRLLILSRGRGAQGPVIGPNQAAILVRLLTAGERVPAGAHYRSLPGAVGACRPWLERETRDASGPGPVKIDRSLYCTNGGRTLLVQLTHWADDPRHARYRRAAITLAATVRFARGAGEPPQTPPSPSR